MIPIIKRDSRRSVKLYKLKILDYCMVIVRLFSLHFDAVSFFLLEYYRSIIIMMYYYSTKKYSSNYTSVSRTVDYPITRRNTTKTLYNNPEFLTFMLALHTVNALILSRLVYIHISLLV